MKREYTLNASSFCPIFSNLSASKKSQFITDTTVQIDVPFLLVLRVKSPSTTRSIVENVKPNAIKIFTVRGS